MSISKSYRYFAADFETTVYKGQTHTEVWASGIAELYTDDVHLFHSISDTWEWLTKQKGNLCLYYHNLKFDGEFWLYYLLNQLDFKQHYSELNESGSVVKWRKDTTMPNNTIKYSISDRGQWYFILIRQNNRYIEIRDSLKLLPFTLEQIGKSFDTKHKKLSMDYNGFRYAGCEITEEEQEYIKNDVLVLKEALEIMFREGHKELTIGSCCLKEYKTQYSRKTFNLNFPNIYETELDYDIFKSTNAGDYVRKAYHGGWCYVVKGKEGKIYNKGITLDVNSLYPSMMSGESGNYYPVGDPTFWVGNYIPLEAQLPNRYFFVQIKTRFNIKENRLPCIQIKGNVLYKSTEWLVTSDYFDKKTGKYYSHYYDDFGILQECRPVMTVTKTDLKLIEEQYDLDDFEILSGCYFMARKGIFDTYIEKYKKIKLESTGAKRQLAKLFLNNLYGKFATNTDSSFRVAYIKEDGSVGQFSVPEDEKKPSYIPIGAAITSYARNFTIRAAQQNYYGVNKKGFIYADTDSIHCDLDISEIKGVTLHDKNFNCWDAESTWDLGIFVRQKTYVEHCIESELKPIDPYYNIKCAGLPEKCKRLFLISVEGYDPVIHGTDFTPEELDYIKVKREITDFKVGMFIPTGKLIPTHITGGVLLKDSYYTMRER